MGSLWSADNRGKVTGVCGTCKTRYLDGAPIHSDFVLTDAEHTEWMTPCCSRARGALVLDL